MLAHGAGAGFRHPNLLAIGAALAARNVATLRFNFPFMEAGKRRVDSAPVAVDAVAAAAAQAANLEPALPLYVGGHSFGGRMASHAAAQGRLDARGLVLLSFPLHPAGRPGVERATHLASVELPMLFVSGTRNALADGALLTQAIAAVAPRARLHWLDDADHGYRVRRRVRRDPRPVPDEIAEVVAAFVDPAAG